MRKYKMRHYETLKAGLFPQAFPQGKNGGETKHGEMLDEPQMDHNPEPQQPALDKIWEWLGNPDEY